MHCPNDGVELDITYQLSDIWAAAMSCSKCHQEYISFFSGKDTYLYYAWPGTGHKLQHISDEEYNKAKEFLNVNKDLFLAYLFYGDSMVSSLEKMVSNGQDLLDKYSESS